MKVAVVHEWLSGRAGSEKTFEAMAEALPEADLFALSREPGVDFDFGGRRVTTTFLDRPRLRNRRELTLPMMPLAWKSITAPADYDLVITSSHAFSRFFPAASRAVHLCYCYAPMRYAWDPEIDRQRIRDVPGLGLARWILKKADLGTTDSVDEFAGISTAVADRIRRHYGQDARVIFPPVDLEFFDIDPSVSRARFRALAVSRFIPYKRLDLAIEACARANVALTVAGSGPDEARLRALAHSLRADVEFAIAPSDEQLRRLYQSSSVLIFVANEDFGIVPVEAQACGTPVIGLDEGGTRDTVQHGVTGLRVAAQDAEHVAAALAELRRMPPDPLACREHAQTFDRRHFIRIVRGWVEEHSAELVRPHR